MTGETGAGKTMILTALNLILGGKSDSALVRKGSERLVASGRFSVPPELSEAFDEAGLSIEDGELILTRSVNSDGKSKAMCNSITVPASALLAASENLVEVHAQAANLNMTKAAKQRDLLDRFRWGTFEEVVKQLPRSPFQLSRFEEPNLSDEKKYRFTGSPVRCIARIRFSHAET